MKINKKYLLSIIYSLYWPLISFNILFLILYEFRSSQEICKAIIVALFGEKLSNNISNILKNPIKFWSIDSGFTGIQIIRNLLFILFVIGVARGVVCIIKKFWYWINYKKSLEGNLEIQLDKYIKNNYGKCFLVTGEWGTGKTYKVNNFIAKYKRSHNKHIYNISCFGLSSREELIKQIKMSCEKQDCNYKTRILDMVKYIPIVGEALYKLLRNDYELPDLKQDSIFIFDDFERIAPSKILDRMSIDNFQIQSYRGISYDEFNDQLDKVRDGLIYLDKEQSLNMEYIKMFRYDMVAGLIDELIERYKMKVIVICSSSIGNYYLNELFINKLGALRYSVANENVSFKSIAENNLKDCCSINEFKRKKIQEFIDENHEDINIVWKSNKCKNLRNMSSIFMEFVSIIEQFNDDEVKEYYFYWKSIFYSLLYSYIKGNDRLRPKDLGSDVFEDSLGENLCIACNDINYNNNISYSVGGVFNNVKNKSNIMWMGNEFYEKYLSGNYIEKDFLFEVFDKLDKYESRVIENIVVMNGEGEEQVIEGEVDFRHILSLLLEFSDEDITSFFKYNEQIQIKFGNKRILKKIESLLINGVIDDSFSNDVINQIMNKNIIKNKIITNVLFRNIDRALNSIDKNKEIDDENKNNISKVSPLIKFIESISSEYTVWKEENDKVTLKV